MNSHDMKCQSPTKRMANLYSLSVEGLTLHEKKELLDFCLRKRRLEIRTRDAHYSYEHLNKLPKHYQYRLFHAVLYSDHCPEYLISSNNMKETIDELNISGSSEWVILFEK
jgi:hypothetical protein